MTMSSANNNALEWVKQWDISFMETKNSKGPSRLPCGKPVGIFLTEDVVFATTVC